MKGLILALACLFSACAPPLHRDAIVRVAFMGSNGAKGYGTGFAISDTLILTAAHLCNPPVPDPTFYFDGGMLFVDKYDEEVDLCLMRSVEAGFEHFLTIAEDKARLYSGVTLIGHPLGIPLQVRTFGEYEGDTNGMWNHPRSLFSMQSYKGNSGGPIFDSNNQVVSVLIEVAPMYTQISFGVTLSDIWAFLTTEDPYSTAAAPLSIQKEVSPAPKAHPKKNRGHQKPKHR